MFDQMCQMRHEAGNEEYGPVAFLENDTLLMALEELADLSNYARYTFIKVYILADRLGKIQPEEQIGANAFTPVAKKGPTE